MVYLSFLSSIDKPFLDKISNNQKNVEAKNKGNIMTLVDFLELAKAKEIFGISINIEEFLLLYIFFATPLPFISFIEHI